MDVPAEWETPIHSMDMVVEVINDEGVARGVTATLEATQAITGVEVTDAYVDKGYRGHGYTGSTCFHIAGSRLKNATRTERRRRRRRLSHVD